MKKLLLPIVVLFLTVNLNTLVAQEYTNSVGIRGAFINPGITFDHFIASDRDVEGILGLRYGGFSITGLYKLRKQTAFNVPELCWYYGLGAHIGLYNAASYNYYSGGNLMEGGSGMVPEIGVDGIFGLEYKLTEVPFTVSLDLKPFFDVFNRSSDFIDIGVSIRYIIK